VIDRYVTIDRLAVGGMGEVFLARQEGAGGFRRTVVLKRLLPDAEGNDEAVHRLLDEARVVAALAHENVVSIIEIGEPTDARGVRDAREPPFLALEYVHGENCGTVRVRAYKRGIEMPIVVAARIVADVARGLHHAHAAKDVNGKPLHIVHRDVAPKNILIRHDGVAKITDFGIAWSQDRLSHTATGNVAGTLTYMSPEQVAAKPVDGKSDQFALGVVLWELLACKRLFKSETPVGTVEKILTEELEPPSHHRAEVPPALDAIALRMLSRDPAARFANCEEVASAIEHALPDASMTVGRAAVAVFLEHVMGEEMRERQRRIESGVAHPMYSSAPAAGGAHSGAYSGAHVDVTQSNSVTSSVDSVRRQQAGSDDTSATGNSAAAGDTAGDAAGDASGRAAALQQPEAVAPRTGLATLGTLRLAVAFAFVVGLVVASAVFWPRQESWLTDTRDHLVETLDWGDLQMREALIVHATNAGVDEALAEKVAGELVELQRQRLGLLLTHWRKDAATRDREHPSLVEREKAIVAQAKRHIAAIADPAVRSYFMTRWTWDASVPIRWVPPPSLEEIQRELQNGEELTDDNKRLRWQNVDRIARRAHIDPAFVRSVLEEPVREREALLESFKRAPPSELRALEERVHTIAKDGREALLKAKVPEKVAKAIAAAAFVVVSESTEPDMWFDDEVPFD
jgi:hypothetical protein